ncbi:MAG: DUF1778 domain-containing protein [Alphaproteobacteria bacterium]|nr:DUF1778 domain-containing protein [Alphaproteobacteria bacterium]
MAVARPKTERIDIRTTRATKVTLQRAAGAAAKTVSDFLLDAGLVAAEQTLADRRSFTLDEKKWRAFQAALDRPVKTKKRLAALLTQPGALD